MSESASTSTASTPPTTTPAAAAAAAAGAGTGAASQISRQDLILLVQKLQKRATTAEQTVTSLKTKLEAAQAEIAASKAAAAATTSTSTIDPVKEQLIKDQQHQIEKLTQQCATLQAAATTAAAASTSQASTSVISSTSSTDTTLIQSLEQQIEQHKTELSSLRVQLQRIESERDATIAKLTQQHNTELQTTLNNVQDLKREREQLRREIESLKTTAAATTSSPAEAPKATSPSPDMESFHQLQASNAKLNAAILELENNNAKLAETLLKKKAQIKTLEKEYNEFKEKTKADLATVEAKSTAADQRLVKTFQLLTAEKNTVKEQNEAMEELRRTLTRTQSDAAELIQQQQAVMTQSQKTIEQLQHDYNMLKQELIRREENEDNNLDHQRELQRKIEENRELLSELEHERMIRERERLQRDRDAAMDKEERERMLDDFEREKLRLTREHNEAITAAETKIKQLLAKVKAGAKKLKEMTAEETELKAKLEAAEAATAACRAEITSLHAEHTRLTTDFESEKLSINTRHNERYEKLLRELKTVKDNNNKTINEQAIRLQELTAQVMKLEEEIATGKPSERRIFELANLQARREEQVQRSQMEMSQLKAKNKEYKSKLRMVLDERDFLSDQVKQLTKSRSRAQVNLDYLKSIMVRFISFENRHPQRRALIPVIATILQFTEEDLKTIEESSGTGQQSGWLSKMSGGWLGSNTETPVPHLPTSNSLPLHLTVSSTVNLDPVVPDHGVNDRIAKSDAVSRQLQLELADEAKGQHSQHGSRRGSNPNSRPFTPTSLATDNYSPLSSPNSIPSSASSYSRRLQANAAANTPNTNNTTHHTHSSADRHIVSSSSSPFTFTSSSITSPTPSSQPHSSHPNGNGDTHSPSQPQPQQISAPTTTTAPTATRASDVDDLFGAVEVQQ